MRPWDRLGGTAQQWVAASTSDGYWRFISNASSSNRCIDLESASTKNGTSIRLWDNYSNDALAWQVTSVGNGYYKITSKLNTSRGWDVPNCTIDGTQNMQLWDYYGTSCRLYKFNYKGSKSTVTFTGDNAEEYQLYPDPSNNGNFTLRVPAFSISENVQLIIYTAEGRRVFEQNNLRTGENFINSKLAMGVYVVKAVTDDSV